MGIVQKSKLVKLEIPLEYVDEKGKKQVLESILFERLKLKHLEVLPSSVFETFAQMEEDNTISLSPSDTYALIKACSNVPEQVLGEVDLTANLSGIIEEINDFFI